LRMRGTRKELLLFYHIIILMIFFHRKYAVTFENAFSWQAPFSPMRWLYDLEEGQEESEAREREGGRERERETHGSSSLSLSLSSLSLSSPLHKSRGEQSGRIRMATRQTAKQLLLSVQILW